MNPVSLTELRPLFHSPLVTFEVAGAAALNDALLDEMEAWRREESGVGRSNVGGWHSPDTLFERTGPACRTLCGHIIEAVRQASLAVSPGFDVSRWAAQAEGWFNVLEPGSLNTPHDHPAWVWSGCYYVAVPDDDADGGRIEFLDTRTNLRTLTVEGAECFASKFAVHPRAGSLLVFPSYLRHWVFPNHADTNRVSVAFNARFVRIPQH